MKRVCYDKQSCGIRIKMLRMKHNLTQDEFAQIVHTSCSNIAKIETGVSTPSIDLLLEIRELFMVPVDYFLFGTPLLPQSLIEKLQKTIVLLHELVVDFQMLNTIH